MNDTERLIEEANGFYSASTDAMCLVANLAAALRAERERADKATVSDGEQKQRARALELVATDAIRRHDEITAGLRAELAAARAELTRLTTPRPIAEAPRESGKQIIALWMHGDEVESTVLAHDQRGNDRRSQVSEIHHPRSPTEAIGLTRKNSAPCRVPVLG